MFKTSGAINIRRSLRKYVFMKNHFCSYCMNFACPLNNVTDEIKTKFFNKNPVVRDAWKK